MGKIVVGLLAFSMVAFIGTDLLQGNSALFGQQNVVGEIDGQTIKYEDFNQKVEELSYNFSLNSGRNPSSEELEQIRQQAWQELIFENVFFDEFRELGIEVTDAELVDMVQGNNIDPQIRQFFSDPNTGQFDKQNVIAFLNSLNSAQANPQQVQAWRSFESQLGPNRTLSKYENLLELTKFANKYEAKAEYQKQAKATVDYLYVPFISVPDSAFEATESEMRAYLNDNADKYKRDASKSIKYVTFDITPSKEDTAFIEREMQALREGLVNADDDSTYVMINSEGNNPYRVYTNAGELPESLLDENGDPLPEGTVTEPIIEGSNYAIYKMSKAGAGDENFVRASHILFKPVDSSATAKQEARQEARRVLNEIRGGADFASMAATYGTDGTASRGGDLGWFGENSAFVEDFKDAVFAFNGEGLLPDVVETEFGYHIIKVTEPKTNVIYEVASITQEIFASDATTNNIYREADLFSTETGSEEEFEAKAEELGLDVKTANNLGKNAKRIGSIAEARSVVYWLFNKASNGDVSEVFELDDQYVVAIQTAEQEEGTATLEQVRNELERKVINQKKADYISEKLAELVGSYEEIAANYEGDARTGNAELTLGDNSLGNAGIAPEAVGVAFSLQQGESTRPFAVENGVMMLTVTSKEDPAEVASYDAYRPVVLNTRRTFRRSQVPATYQNIYNALTQTAEIEDNRYKFY
jgi:peptidyl-prolyl cis-trans isomerase D